jgi:hypothetical protein
MIQLSELQVSFKFFNEIIGGERAFSKCYASVTCYYIGNWVLLAIGRDHLP